MQTAFAHTLMLVVATATGCCGWFMAHNPERALRLLTFGSEPTFGKRFFLGWSKGAGWFFTMFGCFGIALYSVLVAADLFTVLNQAGK